MKNKYLTIKTCTVNVKNNLQSLEDYGKEIEKYYLHNKKV